MEKKIVSIVIPTYNMEEYLGRCLDSVLHKDVLDDTEIIVVNDGSKDRSLEIAKSYQERFPKTVVVVDKPNGNYGSCINKALEIATGKYFRILDADDWFNTEGFVEYVKLLRTISVDMVVTHCARVYSKGKTIISRTKAQVLNKIFSIDDDALSSINVGEDFVMHKITYSTQLLHNVGLKHLEGISYTDIEYVYYPLEKVRTVIFLDVLLYNYFIGRAEQTMSFSSRISHSMDLEKIILRILSNKNKSSSIRMQNMQKDFLCRTFAGYYHLLLVIQDLTKYNVDKLLKVDSAIFDFDQDVYKQLDDIRTWRIPFIKFWRKYHRQIIIPILYRAMYRLYYTSF